MRTSAVKAVTAAAAASAVAIPSHLTTPDVAIYMSDMSDMSDMHAIYMDALYMSATNVIAAGLPTQHRSGS